MLFKQINGFWYFGKSFDTNKELQHKPILLFSANVYLAASLVSYNICDDAGRNELHRSLHAVGTVSIFQSCQRTFCHFCLCDADYPDEHAGQWLFYGSPPHYLLKNESFPSPPYLGKKEPTFTSTSPSPSPSPTFTSISPLTPPPPTFHWTPLDPPLALQICHFVEDNRSLFIYGLQIHKVCRSIMLKLAHHSESCRTKTRSKTFTYH